MLRSIVSFFSTPECESIIKKIESIKSNALAHCSEMTEDEFYKLIIFIDDGSIRQPYFKKFGNDDTCEYDYTKPAERLKTRIEFVLDDSEELTYNTWPSLTKMIGHFRQSDEATKIRFVEKFWLPIAKVAQALISIQNRPNPQMRSINAITLEGLRQILATRPQALNNAIRELSGIRRYHQRYDQMRNMFLMLYCFTETIRAQSINSQFHKITEPQIIITILSYVALDTGINFRLLDEMRNTPRLNTIYFTIEGENIKYRTFLTPGEDLVLLDTQDGQLHESLSLAIRERNVHRMPEETNNFVISKLKNRNHIDKPDSMIISEALINNVVRCEEPSFSSFNNAMTR
ncbi:MAG: hypothetical protein KBD83_05630 [Gammaproteobacteria bacterium]|nr:hypothetical protein [Gammaproteobacteria bacterium]